MAWGLGVDGRRAEGLQSPHRAPKALCGSCDARDGERIRSRGLSRPGWREIAGTLGQLQAGRQAGNGMACSRAKARLNWVSQGQRPGEMQSEAARRAGDPSHQSEDPPPEGLGGHDLLTQADAGCPAGQVNAPSPGPPARRRWRRSAPDGMWFSPTPYLRSRMAFSTSAWRR